MKADSIHYQSYLLRLWRETPPGEWRASLQDVSTGNCHYFATLELLFTYLQQRTVENSIHPSAKTILHVFEKEVKSE